MVSQSTNQTRRGSRKRQRLAQGAAQAELARSYGVSQSTISRLAAPGPFEEARSAREEAEVNETWQLVSGIAADW